MNARSSSVVLCLVALVGFSTPVSAKKPGPPVTAPFCGNAIIEADRGEVCDGNENLGVADCTTVDGGFTAGTLTCNSNCQYDTTACTTCNNGVIETGEVCESDNLQGHTCRSVTGFGFGELACSSTCQTFETDGCERYTQNELTVTDSVTGLMWQRTSADPGITNKDNQYGWTADFFDYPEPTGAVFTEFLAGLNGLPSHTYQGCESSVATPSDTSFCGRGPACFAGYCDWRLPESWELLSIVDGSGIHPAIDQARFGPTDVDKYWSATRPDGLCIVGDFFAAPPQAVWVVDFFNGDAFCASAWHTGFFPQPDEQVVHPARAVRYVGDQAP
jgi:hypothetical protein